MSCQALCHDLTACRNFSLLDADYCYVHNQIPEIHAQKKRWINRHIMGYGGYGAFYHNDLLRQKQILKDLRNKKVVLTETDISNIPLRFKYLDIYVLLVKHNYATYNWNPPLMMLCYQYMMKFHPTNLNGPSGNQDLIQDIHQHIVLKNSSSFFDFLGLVPMIEEKIHFSSEEAKARFRITVSTYVAACLEHSEAARELSWWPKSSLEVLMKTYTDVHKLNEEHPYYNCLIQRWLPELYELNYTEKQIQKIKMDHCKEELMMNRWHPDRVEWLMNQGIEVENM